MIIGERKHTFPSRTRSLSSQPPMVVRPRCRARVGCCQSNGAGYPKGCPAPLVFGIAARTTAENVRTRGVFGKLLTHFVKRKLYFVQLFKSILGRASLRPIHCCQSNEPRCPKGCRGSLCMRMSARTTAGVCPNKGCLGKLLTHFVKRKLYFVQL